jgi:hypothetical protein
MDVTTVVVIVITIALMVIIQPITNGREDSGNKLITGNVFASLRVFCGSLKKSFIICLIKDDCLGILSEELV